MKINCLILGKGMLLIFCLLPFCLFAQDNHNYITPKGAELFFREVQNADRTVLKMSEISPLPANTDGLCVSFWLRANLDQMTRPLKLVSFSISTEDLSFLDIFYHEGTLTFRRKHSSGSNFYYDYNLYDPLFTSGSGVTNWEIKIFFTAYFFWIETRNARFPLNNKYHNPIFFGVNLPHHDFMRDYLSRSGYARIIFGDPNPPAAFMMPEEIIVNAFNYSDLKNELQTNFCEGN